MQTLDPPPQHTQISVREKIVVILIVSFGISSLESSVGPMLGPSPDPEELLKTRSEWDPVT